ncbi:FAD-binding oxidoreductase [Halarsenatibacter silvermanii]|uniref:Glycolate oxidase n=1 Tax=Halarsenatibacter silvermanii TaxID=321763 RepID=A0A1G9QTX2_9FIRM|nr:FAD-linked oxidase C-terminal domain-containing protein [Halarsenatibacter silvermanii]SDM14479.1 glycolate oxidase [Halarsenatibacter silvermanii]
MEVVKDRSLIKELEEIVGPRWVDTDPDRVLSYAGEYTNDAFDQLAPEPVPGSIVVKPEGAKEISEILGVANKREVPVVPKGGATAVAGNGIVTEPSIILVLERLNNRIEIDETNLTVTCDAAVTLGELLEEMESHDKLHFPLHPGDEGAQLGGMAVMNAGGVRAVRDGIMRDQITGLKAVLPTGEIVDFGNSSGKLVKNNAGYDLTQLIIGSEGTLGVITEVTLKLKPIKSAGATLIIPFEERGRAFAAVPAILKEGIKPVAIEYVEKDSIIASAEDLGKDWPARSGEGHLMIILSEDDEEKLYSRAAEIENISQNYGGLNTLIAETEQEQRDLLEIRSHFVLALDNELIDIPDITVPVSELDRIMSEIESLSQEYDAEVTMLAHAGDGNLHPFIMKSDDEDGKISDEFYKFKRKMYEAAISMGGTITGEHGVGLMRKKELKLQYTERELEIMKSIKRAFDPQNILSPGKIFEMEKR